MRRAICLAAVLVAVAGFAQGAGSSATYSIAALRAAAFRAMSFAPDDEQENGVRALNLLAAGAQQYAAVQTQLANGWELVKIKKEKK